MPQMACKLKEKRDQKNYYRCDSYTSLIEKAIEKNADAILVHHGYFWKVKTRAFEE